MVNKYEGLCAACGAIVPAQGGTVHKVGRRWQVRHLTCDAGGQVNEFRIGSRTYTRNSRGRCEDAPCCGCCTI